MVTRAAGKPLRVGDKDWVRWGLDEVEGEVIELYGAGQLARAMVSVPIRGARGEELAREEFSLPLDVIRRS